MKRLLLYPLASLVIIQFFLGMPTSPPVPGSGVGGSGKATKHSKDGGFEDGGRIGGCEPCLGSDGVGQRWQLSGASGQGLLSLIVW